MGNKDVPAEREQAVRINDVVSGLAIYNILVPDSPHLYFVASDRNEYDEIVWLMFSSFDDYAEKTCVVEPTEYSWLKRRSVVAVPKALLRKAQRAGLESRFLARRMKSMIRESLR